MRKIGIRSIVSRRFRPYRSESVAYERKNILKRDFATDGYSFSKTMDTQIIITELDNSYKTQKPTAPLIFNSDLGTQYTSVEFNYISFYDKISVK